MLYYPQGLKARICSKCTDIWWSIWWSKLRW